MVITVDKTLTANEAISFLANILNPKYALADGGSIYVMTLERYANRVIEKNLITA